MALRSQTDRGILRLAAPAFLALVALAKLGRYVLVAWLAEGWVAE